MRLIRNPSYKHSEELIKKFNQYKASIHQKDHSQYTEDALITLLHSIEECKKLGIKSSHILWLTKQLWDNNVDTKKRANEDYIPLVKAHFANQKLLEPIESYQNISQLNRAINSLSEDEVILEDEYDVFYERDGWFIAMPHTTQASCVLGKDTDWCTARTKSDNLFLAYVGAYSDTIVLFYVIKINGNPLSDPFDKMCIGFSRGYPVFDGVDGGLTVNAENTGFYESKFQKVLGYDLAKDFMEKMKEKVASIKGKHPAKKEMEKIAKSTDRYLQKISEFKDEDNLFYFNNEIAKYPINEEIQSILLESPHLDIKLNMAANEKISEKTQLKLVDSLELEETRRTLAKNGCITEKTQEKLANDRLESVRIALALNKNISEKIQMLLSEDMDALPGLAENRNITEKVQLKIAADSRVNSYNKRFILNLAENPSITERVQFALAENRYGMFMLALNQSITENVQMYLTDHENEGVRERLAMNKKITENVKYKLLEDKEKYVRAELAKSDNNPEQIQMILSKDEEDVQIALAKNPTITESVQLNLIKEAKSDHIPEFLATNKRITEKTQLILAKHPNRFARIELAANSAITEKVQLILSKDPTNDVVHALCANNALKEYIRKELIMIGRGC